MALKVESFDHKTKKLINALNLKALFQNGK